MLNRLHLVLLFAWFLIVQVRVQCVETVDPRCSFPTVEELLEIKELPNPFVFYADRI